MLLHNIAHPEEFKLLCDGLLRSEFGHVTTFGGRGPDGGVDAILRGSVAGLDGEWIFQYKYVETSDPARSRGRLLQHFRSTKRQQSEFTKVSARRPVGYVILTNADVTVDAYDKLLLLANDHLPHTRLLVWDSSALNSMLRGREYLVQAASASRQEAARAIVRDTLEWLSRFKRGAYSFHAEPLWPTLLRYRGTLEPAVALTSGPIARQKWQLDIDNSILMIVQHPAFSMASEALFPNAFSFLSALVAHSNRYLNPLQGYVFKLSRELRDRVPALSDPRAQFRPLETLPLAYSILEAAWGTCGSGITIEVGTPGTIRRNSTVVCTGPNVEAVVAALDAVMSEERESDVRHELGSKRRRVLELIELTDDALWYPAELGLDAPGPYHAKLRPRQWGGFATSDGTEET